MKRTALYSLLLSLALPTIGYAESQPKGNSSQIEIGGGVGATDLLGIGYKGEYGDRLKLKPMFRFTGVNQNNSSEKEDASYSFTGIMPLSANKNYGYESHSKIDNSGINLAYGLSADYRIDPSNSLSAGIKGRLSSLDVDGDRTELLMVPVGQIPTPRCSTVSNLSGYNHSNDLELSAGYHYTTKESSSFSDGFDFDYTFSRISDELKRDQIVIGQVNFIDFSKSNLHTEGVSQKHRLQGNWSSHFGVVKLNLGAFYEDRLLTSEDQQKFEGLNNPARGLENLDEEFRHRYRTTGAYALAVSRIGKVSLSARLEYDYTNMEGHHLSDVLPTASAVWNMNSSNRLSARYARRLIRPSLELLNPAKIVGTFSCDYGNEELIGMHVNNINLEHVLSLGKTSLNSSLTHIFANDGFNAIWMERNGIRNYTWGNEGKRRAYSLTENFSVKPAESTHVNVSLNIIWDKRVADAIHMAKEHWGATAKLGLEQKLTKTTNLDLHGQYSEGNTVDLYSHEGRSLGAGATLRQSFGKDLQLSLSYDYHDHPKLVITQGAYTGSLHQREGSRHALSLNLVYKF